MNKVKQKVNKVKMNKLRKKETNQEKSENTNEEWFPTKTTIWSRFQKFIL